MKSQTGYLVGFIVAMAVVWGVAGYLMGPILEAGGALAMVLWLLFVVGVNFLLAGWWAQRVNRYFDDLEKVGRRNGSDVSEFSDVNQMLKVSYNKATGVKTIVDRHGNNQRLTFYGPKVITNISGLDPVNESRTYTIFCRPMPKDVADSGVITGINETEVSLLELIEDMNGDWVEQPRTLQLQEQ